MHVSKILLRDAQGIYAFNTQTQMDMLAFLMVALCIRLVVFASLCVCTSVCVRMLMNFVSANFQCKAVSSNVVGVSCDHDY